ncbi:MAG: hypothetical protein VXW65_10940 [Pseudomonadota bacterium]|nr:hypothetical protein [Pseudomonadota bacterium]
MSGQDHAHARCTHSRIKHVIRYPLGIVLLLGASLAHATQPLSDQELNHRYLSYSPTENAVVVAINPAANAESVLAETQQLLARTLRMIDRDNVDNLLVWQDRKTNAVGANLTGLDASREVLQMQPALGFGSEPYSFRWSGNLSQVVEVSRLTGFSLYGVDVDLHRINGIVNVEARVF